MWFFIPWMVLFLRRRAIDPAVTWAEPGYPLKTWREIFVTSFWMSWLLTSVAYAWYLSLPLTQVGANTTVYQSASVFVFLFSIFLLGEHVTIRKMSSVALSVFGVALIATSSTSNDQESQASGGSKGPLGYIYLVISVLLYALYEVLYKYCIEEGDSEKQKVAGSAEPLLLHDPEGATSIQVHGENCTVVAQSNQPTSAGAQLLLELEFPMLLSALVGVVSVLSQWPVFFALEQLPTSSPLFEANTFSFSAGDWQLLAINSFLDSWYYMLLVFGIAMTGPVFMSVGVMLVSPVSIVVDYFLHNTVLAAGGWIGVVAVVLGFVALQVDSKQAILESSIRCRRQGRCSCSLYFENGS
jgi:drug/metabolite transporter (DMT)-like permease